MSFVAKLSELKAQTRKVWALSLPYFQSDEKWKARGLLLAIVLLNLGAVYMLVQINDWYRLFYDALQVKNQTVFWQQLLRFTYLAFAYVIIEVYKFYLTQLLQVRWRAWMTRHYTQRWLAHKAFYTLELMRFSKYAPLLADNPDQRIQEDVNLFTTDSVALSMGLLNQVVTLLSFTGILWGLSSGFEFTLGASTYVVEGFMVWMAILYAIAGSFITHWIGKPLIALNFNQQRYEADFRHHMVRVREYSEAIALDKGEVVERTALDTRFSAVFKNYVKLIATEKRLTWFTVGFGQAAIIFPFIVAAPRFFSGAIQLGQVMQIASAFGYVQEALSWLVDNYANIAAWKATTDRLTSFEASLVTVETQNIQQNRAQAQSNIARAAIKSAAIANPANAAGALQLHNLALSLPSGSPLLQHAELRAQAGDSIIVSGPSGSGKSTLFRAIAGIWPFTNLGSSGGTGSAGSILRPDGFDAQAMFIPQRPYFPNASLRIALAYPNDATNYTDEALCAALDEALLPHLKTRLDDEDAWGQKLSGGEQQRLALARVFLKKPRWVFADEATSALDEAAEKTVYERLLAHVRLAQGALISIAHRPAVAAFHTTRWRFEPAAAGADAKFVISSAAT
jgi:vitamin B12/bleomycin/antimicrobial peptide transport system ATP-binding/permease protein